MENLPRQYSSVGSIQDLRTGGRWFDFWLDHYFVQGLKKVIATGFTLLSPLFIASTLAIWRKQPVLKKKNCAEL